MDNRDLSATWRYHNGTKHSYLSVRRSRHYLDWANQPLPFKIYRNLPSLRLPRSVPPFSMSALAAISKLECAVAAERLPDLNELAQLFYFSAGIMKRKQYPGGEICFRAASCTGALYEIELYLVCGDLPELSAGVYQFAPYDFSLHRLREGDYRGVLVEATAREPATARAPAIIICTGTYWRNAWKYQARTYRHFYWDNGTILANLLAAAAALALPARLVMGFVDQEVNRLLDLNTEKEVAISMVALGRSEKQPPPAPKEIAPLNLETVPLSPSEVDYPAMREMHAASMLKSAEEVQSWRGSAPHSEATPTAGRLYPLEPAADLEAAGLRLDETIVRRGSTREFAREPIGFREFSTMIYAATRGIPADFLEPPGTLLNELYIIANAVEGLPSGAYYFNRERQALELLKEGDFREQAGYLGLEQELPADASADVFFMAALEPILKRFGNRGYRAVQLEAGIMGGKLYLASYAQRLGATGLTFYDDDVTAFFSPHAASKSAIFLMALGRSARRKRLV